MKKTRNKQPKGKTKNECKLDPLHLQKQKVADAGDSYSKL